jgi:hypothetical protein
MRYASAELRLKFYTGEFVRDGRYVNLVHTFVRKSGGQYGHASVVL